MQTSHAAPPPAEADRVYEIAAELFGLMATPLRLKIISALCRGEKSVSDLLLEIETTQPNMSQHLGHLYRAGIRARRRDGVQMFDRVSNERAVALSRAVCTQIAIEMDDPQAVEPAERLLMARA
ncbi:ArsR/SmtB family transcription factor [Paucibacter sp. XJ19-41]|uniref:ArsR/SmtB family transcription factor n=1 Tax=Paucibacter sp. XJ19-41 TaxID=2927824 RepID=UPI00234B0200|nr:metalloregulator ArsR/SmtB family transcription factor [Paucibacter sp. XJ19-41]MDC6167113.1 metalloregulator ArsR/SmtB family transcription factor [Paucibacter sp. XJ19-41]